MPCGTKAFIEELERRVGRKLRLGHAGRKTIRLASTGTQARNRGTSPLRNRGRSP
jgi:hypothetical protein